MSYSSSFLSWAGCISKRKLILIIVSSRLLLLLLMSASCHIIPDHNPGDDVLRFDLRLRTYNGSGSKDDLTDCFCLSGHACDLQTFANNKSRKKVRSASLSRNRCADSTRNNKIPKTSSFSTRKRVIYHFLLSPVTKWDAARFLNLAVNPTMRDPLVVSDRRCLDDSGKERQECPDPFLLSEQAHAFFPLFPLTIRYLASFFLLAVPREYLPPTYEGVLALSAIILNLICFVLAALALYDLSYSVATMYGARKGTITTTDHSHQLAMSAALVFSINPGCVFFATAYSESMFAMFTFSGHALAARSMTITYKGGNVKEPILLGLAVFAWMAASYTRSNGTVNAAWLLLLGLAKAFYGYSGTSPMSVSKIFRSLRIFIYHLILAAFVAFPVKYHDFTGYARHCKEQDGHIRPSWCIDGDHSTGAFSLYAYTQRTHWNVGFLRYYQWKQVPNFLLATPILVLGFAAAIKWIEGSMYGYYVHSQQVQDINGSWKQLILKHCPLWVVESLRESVVPSWSLNGEPSLVNNPVALGHYAVLAAVCLVGLTIAHVQISTRLICSSCPALIWFLTDQILSGATKDPRNNNGNDKRESRYHLFQRSYVLIGYCFLYIVLGFVLHVNFLPWT